MAIPIQRLIDDEKRYDYGACVAMAHRAATRQNSLERGGDFWRNPLWLVRIFLPLAYSAVALNARALKSWSLS